MTRSADRRAQIRELIASRPIATQEELRELLAGRGVEVTQATLSRDLAWLGARRAARAGRGVVYELGDAAPPPPLLAELVTSVDDNGSLVVVHTTPGAASAVALAIDRAKLPDLLGTIAGDDAIFLAPKKHAIAGKLAKRIRELVASA